MHPDLPGTSCVNQKSIDWLDRQQLDEGHAYRLRDFVFLHRPLQEFMNLSNIYEYMGHKHQNIGCQSLNTGLYA